MFMLSPHVMSSENELKYIRSASELFIMFLLPRSYSLSPSKYFLREILTCRVSFECKKMCLVVFKPFVDIITDPDFFNLHIIYYIEAQKIAANVHVKAFEYAKSFEDILKIIAKTDDIDALKSIRVALTNRCYRYSLVTKLMQATTLQNLNRSKGVDLDNEKSVLASAGVNKSDINAAKKLRKYINQSTLAKKECEKRLTSLGWELGYQFNDDFKKTLPISSILEHVLGRKFLSQFLETLASQDLVRYSGAEIFYTFIRNPTSEIKVDKNTRKRMEAFLLGLLMRHILKIEFHCASLQVIRDQKYSTNSSKLEKEVEWLQGERRQLEAHLSRTEVWGENLGKWRTVVQSAEVPDEREPLQFVLVVHMAEEETNEGEESVSTGWVVCRSLTQFQELHRKLRPLCSEVRSLELPSNTFKFLFGKTDRSSLEKAKQQIQKYLDFILNDDKLNQSEAVYSFLSPSSDHLKHSTPSPKKSHFSFSTLFKSGSEQSKDGSSVLKESEEEDISQYLDAPVSSDTVDFIKCNGHQSNPGPVRSVEEKMRTAREAQELFVNNVPELLTTLVGTNAAKSGARKVFDAFQEKNTNKHLLYVSFVAKERTVSDLNMFREIFEILMDAAFPEIS
ncbi:PXA and/or Nexin C domain containing protein, partial [Asbolus verrucosus]